MFYKISEGRYTIKKYNYDNKVKNYHLEQKVIKYDHLIKPIQKI